MPPSSSTLWACWKRCCRNPRPRFVSLPIQSLPLVFLVPPSLPDVVLSQGWDPVRGPANTPGEPGPSWQARFLFVAHLLGQPLVPVPDPSTPVPLVGQLLSTSLQLAQRAAVHARKLYESEVLRVEDKVLRANFTECCSSSVPLRLFQSGVD